MNNAEFIVYAESVCFDDPWTAESVNAALDSEYGVYVVEESTGYAIGRISFDEAELHRIAVLPEHRREHAGDRLITRFVSDCAERGAEKVFLEVRSGNVPARRLYEKHGFSVISTRKGYYRDDDAVIYMLDVKNAIQKCSDNDNFSQIS